MQSESTEQAESYSPSLPVYLRPPVAEIVGFKRFKLKLRYAIEDFVRNNISYRSYFALQERNSTIIKAGRSVRLQEALAMDFVARNTTIPVPRVIDVFSYKGKIHIVQENIRGHILEDVWRRLNPEQKGLIIEIVKGYLDQLRALKPPEPGRVQAIDGSALNDVRIENEPWGPFDNHDDSHRFLRHDLYRGQPERYKAIQPSLSKVAGKQYRTVFSHGDFGPHNMILTRHKLYVIDWEMSGWFPEYWDYARAHAARARYKPWWTLFEEAVDRYDDEVEVQLHSSSYWEFYLRQP